MKCAFLIESITNAEMVFVHKLNQMASNSTGARMTHSDVSFAILALRSAPVCVLPKYSLSRDRGRREKRIVFHSCLPKIDSNVSSRVCVCVCLRRPTDVLENQTWSFEWVFMFERKLFLQLTLKSELQAKERRFLLALRSIDDRKRVRNLVNNSNDQWKSVSFELLTPNTISFLRSAIFKWENRRFDTLYRADQKTNSATQLKMSTHFFCHILFSKPRKHRNIRNLLDEKLRIEKISLYTCRSHQCVRFVSSRQRNHFQFQPNRNQRRRHKMQI